MRLITLLFLILLSTCVRAQVVNTLPTIDNPQDADRIGTYTRGFGAAFRLDSLKTYFTETIRNEIVSCYISGNPNDQQSLSIFNCSVLYDSIADETWIPKNGRWIKEFSRHYYDTPFTNRLNEIIVSDVSKISFLFLGDSKTQAENRGASQMIARITEDIGWGGLGYVPLDGGTTGFLNISNTGSTLHNGGAGFGNNSLSGHAIELESGDSYALTHPTTPNPKGYSDKVLLFYMAGPTAGTFDVTFGTQTTSIDADAVSEEKKVVVVSDTYGDNDFTINNVTGTVVFTDLIFRSESLTSGVHAHYVGHGGYTYESIKARISDPVNSAVLDSIAPNYVVIRLGTNDWATDKSPSSVGLSIDTIVSALKTANSAMECMITGVEDATMDAQDYTRREYVSVQAEKAQQYGFIFAPLGYLIPSWERWDSLGYATDLLHSNASGGNAIGEFLYNAIVGRATFSTEGVPEPLAPIEAGAVLYGSSTNKPTGDVNNLVFDQTNDRLGLFTSTPQYDLDFPHSSTRDFRIGLLKYSLADGLSWNDGLLTDKHEVNFNMRSKFKINANGSNSGFEVAGISPIILSDYLKIGENVPGQFRFNSIGSSGADVRFDMHAGTDFTVFQNSGSSANFEVIWGSQSLIKTYYNKVEFGVQILMANLPNGNGVGSTGLMYRNTSDALRELSWSDVTSTLDSEGMATDAELSAASADDQTLQEVTDEGAITTAIVTAKGLTAKNTSGAGVLRANRTDGKIAILAAGGSNSVFAYDETGEFNIGSNDRSTLESDAITGTESRLFIDQSGNVGLSDIAPTQRLDVNGGARVRDTNKGAAVSLIGRLADGTLTDAASPGPTRVTRTANLTRTSASVATDASLTTASLASGLYKFKAVLVYRGSDVDTDLEYEVERTFSLNDFSMSRSNDATSVRGLQGYPYLGDVATTSSTATHIVIIEGTFYNNLGNAIKIDWGGTDAVGSITMIRGSYLETEKID
jgi:hypothetical protein